MELRIKEILEEKHMTLGALADEMGVSRQALSRQVNGKMLLETADRIAGKLNVPLWQLFASPKDVGQQSETSHESVGMIICPHCHGGIEITGVVHRPEGNTLLPNG